MNRYDVLSHIRKSGVVSILRRPSRDVIEIAAALKDAGISAVEVTVDTPGVLNLVGELREAYEDMVIGVGTVLDPETARAAILAGAQYIVTPTLNVRTIEIANRYDRLIIPGVLTPTEILTAFEAGASAVKLFPASSLGPEYVRHVRGPLSHIPLIPTGGVNLDNIAAYIKAGAVAVGVGNGLIGQRAGTRQQMADTARKFVDAVEAARQTTNN